MKFYGVGILVLFAVGCGGSDSTNDSNTESEEVKVESCSISNDTISLKSGESCELSDSQANVYGTSSGDLSCNSGTLTYNGNTFTSGQAGITFNGLTFVCAK